MLPSARAAHEAPLALRDVLAKYNASYRVEYSPSAPVARVMERSTSALVNDADPGQAGDYYLGDGVNEILDAAEEWAGHTTIDKKGQEIWHKRISIVERGLFDLAQ
eukprot:4642240-Pyramimonas_sp.AAC.1